MTRNNRVTFSDDVFVIEIILALSLLLTICFFFFAEECLVFLFSFSEPLQTAAHMFVAYEVSQVTYQGQEPMSRSLRMPPTRDEMKLFIVLDFPPNIGCIVASARANVLNK